jgi:hypothetical protein
MSWAFDLQEVVPQQRMGRFLGRGSLSEGTFEFTDTIREGFDSIVEFFSVG